MSLTQAILQNIRKNFDSDKKKEKMNIFKENLLKYNITELSNNLNNVNKQINDNKSILINNAVINLNMFTDKTEINLENKQNTLKDMKAYHKSPLILRLFNNKKTNFPSIRITDNNESKNKRITNRIHLKTESNIIKEMSQHYKIRNINRTNNFFRLKLNSNLKFNSLYKK